MPKIILVSGPVIVENQHVLVNKHGDTDFWKFCGGRVESFDESLIDTARREAREEMGIELQIQNEQPYLLYTSKKSMDGGVTEVILVHFLAHRIGEIHPGKDIREWKWMRLDQLPDDLGPNVIPALTHFGYINERMIS